MASVSAGMRARKRLTRIEALHPQRKSRLGDGNELQSDVELAPAEVAKPSGST